VDRVILKLYQVIFGIQYGNKFRSQHSVVVTDKVRMFLYQLATFRLEWKACTIQVLVRRGTLIAEIDKKDEALEKCVLEVSTFYLGKW
jgi:hypothetical protein